VIQYVPAAALDPSLRDTVLPRTLERGPHRPYLQGSNRRGNLHSLFAITVENKKLRSRFKRNGFPMISKKGEPALGSLRISRCSFHPARDGSLRNIETQHEKLAMDARCSPRRILDDHSEDQLAHLLRSLSSPNRPAHFGNQLPVQSESSPMPPDHRGQNLRAKTQNSLSNTTSLGLGRLRFSATSC
jgi:hypothetical protein